MKFKNSKREVNFNNFWNDTVVFIDKKIRGYLSEGSVFFPPVVAEVNPHIKNYLDALNSLIKNIQRMCTEYRDQDYVKSYIDATIDAALEDFLFYQTRMRAKGWDMTEMDSFIENTHPLFKVAFMSAGVIEKNKTSLIN